MYICWRLLMKPEPLQRLRTELRGAGISEVKIFQIPESGNQGLIVVDLEAAPIGWQLFILGSRQSDSTALLLFLDTYATRLLAQALSPYKLEKSLIWVMCFPALGE
jgi:hypothetical protein